ncbi:MAG: hypothetical protein ACK526_14100 [Planctomyces sp.]
MNSDSRLVFDPRHQMSATKSTLRDLLQVEQAIKHRCELPARFQWAADYSKPFHPRLITEPRLNLAADLIRDPVDRLEA